MATRKTTPKTAPKPAPKATRYSETAEIGKVDAKRLGIDEGEYRISTLVYALCNAGADNDALFDAVKEFFPTSKCAEKKPLVTWYRFNGERIGKVTTPRPDAEGGPQTARKTRPKAKTVRRQGRARKTA
jgi:hypothetical protein